MLLVARIASTWETLLLALTKPLVVSLFKHTRVILPQRRQSHAISLLLITSPLSCPSSFSIPFSRFHSLPQYEAARIARLGSKKIREIPQASNRPSDIVLKSRRLAAAFLCEILPSNGIPRLYTPSFWESVRIAWRVRIFPLTKNFFDWSTEREWKS